MNRLYIIVKMIWQTLRKAPGAAITIQVESANGENREIEYYQLPGISAGPTPQDRAATVDLGGYRVAIASHNYRIEVETEAGAITIFSTNAAGDTVASRIDLDTAGNIDLNGNTKTFVTHAELTTALQTFATALNLHTHPDPSSGTTGPPTSPMTIDISTATTTTIRTDG